MNNGSFEFSLKEAREYAKYGTFLQLFDGEAGINCFVQVYLLNDGTYEVRTQPPNVLKAKMKPVVWQKHTKLSLHWPPVEA